MEEGSKNRASLSERALRGNPGGSAPLLVSPKEPEGSENGRVSIGAPLLGNKEGRSFPRVFERNDKFLYLGKFLRKI
jgi:hypothetical protein